MHRALPVEDETGQQADKDPTSIVHLSKYYPPEWGGIETVARDLSEGLSSRGIRVVVIAFSRVRTESGVSNGVEVRRFRQFASFASQPLSLRWMIEACRAFKSADTIIMQWPNYLPALLIPWMGRRRLYIHWQSDISHKGIWGLLAWPLQAALLTRATVVMPSTDDYLNGSRALKRFKNKAAALPIGIPDPVAGSTIGALPVDVSAQLSGRPYVLAIGRLVPYKGFNRLIEAVAQIDAGYCLIIVGEGPQWISLARLVSQLGIGDRVFLVGRQSPEDLQRLLAHAAVYVMSSTQRGEGFGVVQLEAMAHSLPIVATQVPRSGVAWVSGYGETGAMVAVDSPSAIADAVNGILRGGNRAHFALAARRRFETLFTVDKMVDRFCAIFRGSGR